MTTPNIPEANKIKVDLSLNEMVRGESIIIPQITIYKDQVPVNTKNLYLILEDMSLPLHVPHGVKFIPYIDSDIVLNNSFKLLIPLSPPLGSSHNYQLTVRAFDENHNIISYGNITKSFP